MRGKGNKKVERPQDYSYLVHLVYLYLKTIRCPCIPLYYRELFGIFVILVYQDVPCMIFLFS